MSTINAKSLKERYDRQLKNELIEAARRCELSIIIHKNDLTDSLKKELISKGYSVASNISYYSSDDVWIDWEREKDVNPESNGIIPTAKRIRNIYLSSLRKKQVAAWRDVYEKEFQQILTSIESSPHRRMKIGGLCNVEKGADNPVAREACLRLQKLGFKASIEEPFRDGDNKPCYFSIEY